MKRLARPVLSRALRAALALASLTSLAVPAMHAQTFVYWDLNGLVAGAGGAGGNAPSGTWTSSAAQWNLSADGTGIIFPWVDNAVAVFSAGTNATGAYTVSVGTASGMTVSGFLVQDGTVTLGGTGTLAMVNPLPGIAPYLNHGNASVTIGSGVTLSSLAGFSFGGSGSGSVTLHGTTSVLGTTAIGGTTVHLGAAERLSDVSLVQLAADGVLDLANFNETVGGLGGSGSVVLGSGNLTVSQLADASFTGTISGTGALTKSGAGTLTINQPAGWTGGTAITNGTLALGASHLLPDTTALSIGTSSTFLVGAHSEKLASVSGLGTVSLTGGTLELGGNLGYNFGGAITGFGQFVKSGAATFVLNGTGNFIGTASLTGGTLRLGGNERLNNALDVGVAAGTTLDVNGVTETIDALTGAGTVTLGGGVLAVGTNHAIFALDATVTGPGTLMKTGSGLATLGGTFGPSGSLSIQQGTVALGAADRLGNDVDVFVNSGAAFSLAGFNETIGTLVGLGNVVLGSGALTVTGNTDASYSGVLSGSGTFTKSGTGTLSLLGPSTYTGLTTVNQGRLLLFGENRLAYGIDAAVAAGATIEIGEVDGDGVQYFDTLTGAGDITSTSIYKLSVGLGIDNSSWTFGGRLRGNTEFVKLGSGTLTLTGASDFGGELQIIQGTVLLGGDQRLSTSSFADVGIAPGGKLNLNGHLQTLHDVSGFGTLDLGIGGELRLEADRSTFAYTFDGGLIGFGALKKYGTYTYTLNGPLTFSGPTTIEGGRLKLGNSGTIDTDVAINAGTFDVTDEEVTIDQLTGGGAVVLGAGQLVIGSSGGDFGYSGTITGNAGSRFVKNGAGTFMLGGASSAALHLVNGGTLQVGLDNPFTPTGSVQVQAGQYFNLLGHPVSVSSLLGAGHVVLNSGALTVGTNNATFTFDGAIEGLGTVKKAGTGVFTLAGTIDGPTSVTADTGTLKLGADQRLANPTPLVLNTGATFDLAGFDETLGALTGTGAVKLPATSLLTVGHGNPTFAFDGSLNGDGTFVKAGTGALTFSGKTNGALQLQVAGGRFNLLGHDRLDPKTWLTIDAPAIFDAGIYAQEFAGLSGDGTLITTGAGRVRVGQGNFLGGLQGTGTLEKVGNDPLALEQVQNTTVNLLVTTGSLQLANAGAWTFGSTVVNEHGTLSTVGLASLHGSLVNHGQVLSNGTTTLTGAVSGTGTFAGDLKLVGSLAPGTGTGSPHLTTVTGEVVLGATHTLHLELAGLLRGTEHDGLHADTRIILGGTLHVSLTNGFVPAAGQVFQLLTTGNFVGSFANYDLPALAHGLAWDTSRLRSDGTLRVVSGYAAFIAAAGLDLATNGAPLANPSGDGIANLLKYLLGGDPRVVESDLVPVATVESSGGETVLVFAYTVDALAASTVSLSFVEATTDFLTWNPAIPGSNGVTLTVTHDGYFDHLVYRIPISGPRGFARLRVIY